MRLSVGEQNFLRVRVKNMIPQFKKTEIVSHLVKEGITRSTVYNTIKRLETDPSVKDNKKNGSPSKFNQRK